MRIGQGYDVHAFGGSHPLMIAGVHIPDHQGVLAHSDGDVALHALTDALSGAAAMGDIAGLFPDHDPAFKNADSRVLLRDAWQRIRANGYRPGNADITIIARTPKIAPCVRQMRLSVAKDLICPVEDISVKATTTERPGFTGRSEGIACMAIATLVKARG